MKTACVLYGATDLGSLHFSSDILWRTRFKAPDPLWLIEMNGKRYIFVSALEYGRAKKQAKVDEVILLEHQRGDSSAGHVIDFLKRKKIEKVIVPDSFSYATGRVLGDVFDLETRMPPFYPERAIKTTWEMREIISAQRATEAAMHEAMDFLRRSRIRGKRVYSGSRVVTSEILRDIIDASLYSRGYLGLDTIAACGATAADPHAMGSGPLMPYQPIVLDVFPVSRDTHYYADMTRTVFKGTPSQGLQDMYEAVREAQEVGIKKIKPGADGSAIYRETREFFESREYPTNFNKQPEGFIHGLGHGVGIDIHEAPSMGAGGEILHTGNVVTVEPGLYYHKPRRGIPRGGIRIEDMILVTNAGHQNLTQFPKALSEIIIV